METKLPPIKSVKEWTLDTAIKQLEFCEYEAIGGTLIWNDAFIWLKNQHAAEIERLKSENKEFVAALETIRDSFWTDGETDTEKVTALKETAKDILAKVQP